MFESLYDVEIKGKNVKRFLKTLINLNIHFNKVYIKDNILYITISKKDLDKLNNIKTIYEINVYNIKGFSRLIIEFKRNKPIFISLIVSLVLLLFLSNLVFSINIEHDSKEIRDLINSELNRYGLKKFGFQKSYDEIEIIKDKIIENNKDKIEWIEIERVGCKYVVKVDKRINKKYEKESGYRHITAKKSGIIMKINAKYGDVQTKINDYVKKGDILISGEIKKNEEVKGLVRADGDIYAEVWYKVRVETPLNYKETIKTGNDKNVINIELLNNNFNLFDFSKYKDKTTSINNIINDSFGLFKINFNYEEEVIYKDEINDLIRGDFAYKDARSKIEERLKEGEYILFQKKLKTIINNSTIIIEVFFKVYENITDYLYIEGE